VAVDDPELNQAKHRLWVVLVEAREVFDLTFASAAVVGLTPDQLVSDDHLACQQAGERYGREDEEFPDVWRYPSASLPGTSNLVIFGARAMSTYLLPPVSSVDVPGSIATAVAQGVVVLLSAMRHVGTAHVGLEAYRNGTEHVWDQPTTFPVR
jgi:hypothetical protein